MFIEFIGAAGVGKSYFAAKLLSALAQRGFDVLDFENIRIGRSPRNLNAVLGAAVLGWKIRPKSLRSYVKATKVLARQKIRRRITTDTHGIYICDEGIFHKMRTLFRNSRAQDMMEMSRLVLRYIELPDIIVIIENSSENILIRRSLRNRPGDAYSVASIREDVDLLNASVRTINDAQESTGGKLQVVRLNALTGGGRPDIISEELADVVLDRYSNTCTFQKTVLLS